MVNQMCDISSWKNVWSNEFKITVTEPEPHSASWGHSDPDSNSRSDSNSNSNDDSYNYKQLRANNNTNRLFGRFNFIMVDDSRPTESLRCPRQCQWRLKN